MYQYGTASFQFGHAWKTESEGLKYYIIKVSYLNFTVKEYSDISFWYLQFNYLYEQCQIE